jgi:hypothetical protein
VNRLRAGVQRPRFRATHHVAAKRSVYATKIATLGRNLRLRLRLIRLRAVRRADVRLLTLLASSATGRRFAVVGGLTKIRTLRAVSLGGTTSDRDLRVPDGEAHTSERRRIGEVLTGVRETSVAHRDGLQRLDTLMAKRLSAHGSLSMTAIIEEAVNGWSGSVFGLPDPHPHAAAPPSAIEIGRAAAMCTVFNTVFMRAFDPARARHDVGIVRDFRTRLGTTQSPRTGSVLDALRLSDVDHAHRDLIGLIGGATEILVEAAVSIIDWALVDPRNWAAAHDRAKAAAVPDAFTDAVSDLLELAPPQYFVVRKCPAHTSPVLAADPGKQTHALVGLGQRGGRYSAFGVEPHLCLGRPLALDALAHILHPVFLFAEAGPADHYRPSNPPRFEPTWIRLGHGTP